MPTDSFTDSKMAATLRDELLADRWIYVPGLGWHEWNGRRWVERHEALPMEAVRAWVVAKTREAGLAYAAGTGLVEHLKAWIKLGSYHAIKALTVLGRGQVVVDADRLDAIPDVLNCRNGVVHLKTGDLTPHNPALLLTKMAGCDYVPTALHEDWTAALSAVPADALDWLQVLYGQAITGYANPDDRVLIQQGGGANGKTTVLTGVANALADYYLVASDKILMSSQGSAHTTDFTDLRGARFVAIEELPELGRLDAAALKRVCGTERITARRMRQDNFTFVATHTLVLNTNYAPAVAETDAGTWRRLLLLVFPYTFMAHPLEGNERPGDPRLRERLAASKSGQSEAVLAWLVEGAQRWFEAGRAMPEVPVTVRADTDEWRGRHDHVAAFWADYLTPCLNAWVASADLIWLFNQYMRTHGNSPLAESTFMRRWRTHPATIAAGVEKRRMRADQGERGAQRLSRPYGSLDPFARLPGLPDGQITGWSGLRFRESADNDPLTGCLCSLCAGSAA